MPMAITHAISPAITPVITPKWKHHLLSKEAEAINSVAICGDGSKVVAGTYFYTGGSTPPAKDVGMFAYNQAGKALWSDIYPATYGINWVAVSRDGSWAASGGQISGTNGLINAYNAATGAKALTYNPPAMVNMVTLNSNGTFLVAGSNLLYVFARSGLATWAAPQTAAFANQKVERVAISDDGKWIAAAVSGGTVSLVQNKISSGGGLSSPASWALATGWVLWVSMAASGSGFAAGASDGNVYYFDINAFAASGGSTLKPAWQVALPNCTACRSVAVSDDGSLIAAVGDFKSNPTAGRVFLLSNQGSSAKQMWATVPATAYGVNATSMDAKGKYITVTDGTPAGTAGNFYLFNASSGSLVGSYHVSKMTWPMVISANANGIAAGADNSELYYFSVP